MNSRMSMDLWTLTITSSRIHGICRSRTHHEDGVDGDVWSDVVCGCSGLVGSVVVGCGDGGLLGVVAGCNVDCSSAPETAPEEPYDDDYGEDSTNATADAGGVAFGEVVLWSGHVGWKIHLGDVDQGYQI